jgi:hypothetical protein
MVGDKDIVSVRNTFKHDVGEKVSQGYLHRNPVPAVSTPQMRLTGGLAAGFEHAPAMLAGPGVGRIWTKIAVKGAKTKASHVKGGKRQVDVHYPCVPHIAERARAARDD